MQKTEAGEQEAEEAIREIENYIGGGDEIVIHSEIKID